MITGFVLILTDAGHEHSVYTDLNEIELLLFDSGKLVCSGAKKLSEVNKVLDKFVNRLHSVGLI